MHAVRARVDASACRSDGFGLAVHKAASAVHGDSEAEQWYMGQRVDVNRSGQDDSHAELGEDIHTVPCALAVSLGVRMKFGMAVTPSGRMARVRRCGCPDYASEHAP